MRETGDTRLGQILEMDRPRDAVHIAMIPAGARETQRPGQHVVIIDGQAAGAARGGGVGVVDPFLMDDVDQGERFWLLLFPGTITSLRHEWTHPVSPLDDRLAADVAASRRWLLEHAEMYQVTYDE